jgi:hypothetical protein
MQQRRNVDLTESPSPPAPESPFPLVAYPTGGPNSSVSIDLLSSSIDLSSSSPKTPDVEIRVRKRIVNELKTSKRRNLSRDDVRSLLAVQEKLTSKDPSFSRKLADYAEATEDDEEENSEDYVQYLRVIADNEN